MKKTIEIPAVIPVVAGLTLKYFIAKGERAKSFFRRTCVLAVWLGLMFIGTNVALLGVQPVQASTNLYDVQFNLYSQNQQTGAAIIGQAGDYWNRLAAASGSSALANTAGNMNGASFTWAGTGLLVSGTANPSFGNGDSNLMDCYIFYSSSSGSQNMTFSNLTANAPFNLYIYTQGDSATTGRKLSVTFNGSTNTAAAAVAGTTSFVSGQNYLTISGNTTASGTLPFSYTYAAGEADINGIQLSIGDFAPAITLQPASQTVAAGGTADLSVTATGTGPLVYQWFKNGGMVLGATNSALNVANVGVMNSGVYYVVVTNAYGLSISQPVTVAIGNPQLLAWGDNGSGQLGIGTATLYPPVDLPQTIAGNVVTAAAGDGYSLFVTGDGTLWTMGQNMEGQLGNGTTAEQDSPVSVASNVVAVAAGWAHSLFLKSDGTMWGMGYNGSGELGGGFGFQSKSPGLIASNVVAVAADASGSLYLKNDGTLWVTGGNRYGELGNDSATSPVASNVVSVAAGALHTLYLTGDGTMWAMGANADGELGDGTTNDVSVPESIASNVVAIAAGNNFSLFVKNDGTLWTMGANNSGQLGDGTTISQSLPECVASNVVSVTAGTSFSLFLTSDGTTWAMGDNGDGELGDGTIIQQHSPEAITSLSLANVVSGSMAYHTLAVGISLAPVITSQPVSQTVLAGAPVSFSVTATDVSPITYQWQHYGSDIEGATNATYSIASPSWSDGGWYTVVVTGIRGVAVSQTADLTVIVPMATVTVDADPLEGGSVNGGGMLPIGGGAMLMAMPSPGWLFVNWNDGSTDNPYNILVPDTDTNYTAYFAPAAVLMLYASPEEGGYVIGTGTFVIGSTNPIAAVASNGWAFVQWSDGSTNNPENIVVTSNLELTASFTPATTVTTVAAPLAAGSTAGDGAYAIGSNAILTATPSNGWAFVNWNGTVTNNPWIFPVPSDPAVCTANFAPASTVTALVNPTNAGSVSGGGIIFVGSNTVLTATASSNWGFVSWNDGVTNNPRVVTAPATNITYTADFAATATLTVLASPSSGGSVSGGGTFLAGSTNVITAVAANGWIFTGWNDGTTSGSYAVVATSNQTFTANFAPTVTVTILMNPTNAGAVVTGGGVYRIGSSATLTASIPTLNNQNQWIFLNWNGTVTNYTRTGNTNNPLGLTVTTNITVTANFAQVTSAGLVYTYIWVKPQIIIQLNSSKAKTRFTPESDSLVPEIEIVGYVGYVPTVVISGGPPFTVTVPAEIDGVPVGEIGPEALTGAGKIDVLELDIDDAVSTYTLDGTCAEAADLEFAGDMAALDALLTGGELFVAADALVDCSEVGVAAGLSEAALGILGGIFGSIIGDLAIVYVDASPSNGGSVSGGGLYVHGWPVTLTANPNSGWRFSGWGDGGSGAGTTNRLRTVSAGTQTAPYKANFTQQSTVTVVAMPEDGGLVSGGGTFDVNSDITITATNNLYWKFMAWNDGKTNATRTITVPASDITYTATFEELKLEVEAEADPNIGGVAPGFTTGSGEYGLLDAVTITATPVLPKWKFNKWVLKVAGVPLDTHLFTNSSPVPSVLLFLVTPEMLGLKLTVDADFSTDVEVTTAANPPYAGSVEGAGSCEWPPVMDNLPLVTAIPANGWAFTGWNSPITTNYPGNPFCPILDMVTPLDFTVTANFTPTRLTTYVSGDSLTLDWPAGLVLQSQTNTLAGTNWFDMPGTGASNSVVIIMDPANAAVFYRLRQP